MSFNVVYAAKDKIQNKIAQGVEIARQMQQDGTLKDVDFKNIDELIAKKREIFGIYKEAFCIFL